MSRKIVAALRPLGFALLLLFSALPLFAAEQKVDVDLLRHKTRISIQRMPEFANISIEASRRGLRVWALGGAASSIVDHAKHELLGANYSPRLEWSFNNVLLPEQDVDLVITRANGTVESAKEVEDFLQWVRQQYPYTTDGRSRWEAMGLNVSSQNGRKMAVGADPDFLRQHNDSLSLGMVELTLPPPGEEPFRNLGNKTDFVRDIAESQFHFLYNQTHAQTARFKNGLNPPILSVIRALEKATRYNLDLDSDSVRVMKQIVSQWNPSSVAVDSYVYNYLHGRGKRVLTHAHDLEEALKLVDSLGLKNKLLQLPGANPSTPESLGWWLTRSPLPKKASGGSFTGHTAGSLGIRRAYHWTSHANHRLMTWNYDSNPRLFESRQGAAGEAAVLGNGFYTFANDPSNIRFRSVRTQDQFVEFTVNPAAKEGIDFTYDKATETVVWKSSEHLKVAPQKYSYPQKLSCSSAYAAVAGSANQPFSAAVSAQMLAAARAQAAARQRPLPLHTILYRKQWKDIPDWIGRNPMETLLGGVLGFYAVGRFHEIATQGWDTPKSPEPAQSTPERKKTREDYHDNSACLPKLAEGPACDLELGSEAKRLAKILAEAKPQNVDKKSLLWLSGIKDQSYLACVQKLSSFKLAPNFLLSEYLSQCDGELKEAELSEESLRYWKDSQPIAITAEQFRALAIVPEHLARKCAEAFPEGINVLHGNRLAACLALPSETFGKLKPFLEEVKSTYQQAPLNLSKEMIEMGAKSVACYATLGQVTKDSSLISDTCAEEKPSPEALLILRLAIEKSNTRDWTNRSEEIKAFLKTYRSPESQECARTFMNWRNLSPMAKEALTVCGDPEIGTINKILPETLKIYHQKNWGLSADSLLRLKSLKTDLARRCLRAVIGVENWFPLHEAVISGCASMVKEANLPYFANALHYAKNNRQLVEEFTGVTTNEDVESQNCRQEFGAEGYNPFGPLAKAFCDHKHVAQTNKILRQVLAYHRNKQISLTVEDAEAFQLYSNDLATGCAQAILGTNFWKPLFPDFARACAKVAHKDNIPYLAQAFAYANQNRLTVSDITGITANPDKNALVCRNLMASYGYNAFGELAKAFCDQELVAETNKFLPNLLAFYRNKNKTLTAQSAPALKLYATDLARDCGNVIISTNFWDPLYEPFAKSCAAMEKRENIPYLRNAFVYAANRSHAVNSIHDITAAGDVESLKCREILAQYGASPFDSYAKSFCDHPEAVETNKFLPGLLNFLRNNQASLSEASAPAVKLYTTDLARECGQVLMSAGKNPHYEKFARSCAGVTQKKNISHLASALQYAKQFQGNVEDISSVTANSSEASLGCRELMMPYGFTPFDPTIATYCDNPDAAEVREQLSILLPVYRNKGWRLYADKAEVLRQFKSTGAKDCFKQALGLGIDPLTGSKMTECLAK